MRCEIICELATNHGGDLDLAEDMITAAAEAGADWVKTQGYQIKHLRKTDPQYDWLAQCELDKHGHRRLMRCAERLGVRYLSTAFTLDDAKQLARYGLTAAKIGSGEAQAAWTNDAAKMFATLFVSYPWTIGLCPSGPRHPMATAPVYPMPVECFSRLRHDASLGYSDHSIGIDVAKIAIAKGATVVEKHFSLPGRGRNQSWDMTPDDLRELRRWAEVCAQALDGTKWEGRWTA